MSALFVILHIYRVDLQFIFVYKFMLTFGEISDIIK